MKRRTFTFFVGPSVFIMLALMTVPLLASIVAWGCITSPFAILTNPLWVGLRNYEEVLGDAEFWDSLEFTLLFILAAVPVTNSAGVVICLAAGSD